MRQTIIAGSLAKCVHVWGVHQFLKVAEQVGFEVRFLGPAITPAEFVAAAKHYNATYVALSYRLTPETGQTAIAEFIEAFQSARLHQIKFLFAGTTPVAAIAQQFDFFDKVFDGTSQEQEVLDYLTQARIVPQSNPEWGRLNLVQRLHLQRPYPLLRHHFGRPTICDTVAEIRAISEAEVLDVICIGTDQDAQENFYHPQLQTPHQAGAGGVPVRTEDDFCQIYQASQYGNFPLLRTYCGTRDLIRLAEMYQRTINLCSAGIPIFWYNQLDGRGPMRLEASIQAHQEAIAWHALHNIPVEILGPHQWAMRGAHDVIYVVSGYISAALCKHLGVKHHIAQLMFNTPAEVAFKMDLAKVMAVLELIDPLRDTTFDIIKMSRAGLLSFPADEDEAKGHLAASTMLQLSIHPDMINVVGYSEANRAVTHREVIESCKIVRRIIKSAYRTPFPDMTLDPDVVARKTHLVAEARVLLETIQRLAQQYEEHWLSPHHLARVVSLGILDTPQFKPSDMAKGTIVTRIGENGVNAIHPEGLHVLSEAERLTLLNPGFVYGKQDHVTA